MSDAKVPSEEELVLLADALSRAHYAPTLPLAPRAVPRHCVDGRQRARWRRREHGSAGRRRASERKRNAPFASVVAVASSAPVAALRSSITTPARPGSPTSCTPLPLTSSHTRSPNSNCRTKPKSFDVSLTPKSEAHRVSEFNRVSVGRIRACERRATTTTNLATKSSLATRCAARRARRRCRANRRRPPDWRASARTTRRAAVVPARPRASD